MKVLVRITLALVLVALTALPVMAQATVVTEHDEYDFQFFGINVCLDEPPWVDYGLVDAHLKSVYHATLDGNGGFNLVYNEKVTFGGVSPLTGYRYAGNWTWHEHINGQVGHVETLIWHARSKNLDTNTTAFHDVRVHLVVNGNGEVTVDREVVRDHCSPPL